MDSLDHDRSRTKFLGPRPHNANHSWAAWVNLLLEGNDMSRAELSMHLTLKSRGGYVALVEPSQDNGWPCVAMEYISPREK